MKDQLVLPDVEQLVQVLLDSLTPGPATVGLAVPDGWQAKTSPLHLLVALDGTIVPAHRLTCRALIRVTAFAHSTTVAKAAARQAEARLTAHRGDGVLLSIRTAVGMGVARDEATTAELASFAVNVTARSARL